MYKEGDLKKLAKVLIQSGVDVRRDGNQYSFPIGKKRIVLRQSKSTRTLDNKMAHVYQYEYSCYDDSWRDVSAEWEELQDFIIENVNYD